MDLGRILNDCAVSAKEDATDLPKPRTGKWSEEEERYACALVRSFVDGSLPIPTGTSLRSFLAKKLRCSAMRVSTKLSMDMLGDLKIPKKLGQKRFFPMEGLAESHQRRVAHDLSCLEAAFLHKENLPAESESDGVVTSTEAVFAATSSTNGSDDETEGPLRVGSWSEEEQVYACALIDAFLRGVVNAAEGSTLRAFLAERLCCNPMRVSKKLATGKMGGTTIPKRLGSATFLLNVPVGSEVIMEMERSLEEARFNCFSTGQQRQPYQHHEGPARHFEESYLTLPAPRFNGQFNISQSQWDEYARASKYTAQSPPQTGVKRKLPSLCLPMEPYLPSLKSVGQMKMPRLPSVAFR